MTLSLVTRGYVSARGITPGGLVYLYPENGSVVQNGQLLMVAILAGVAPSDLVVALLSDTPAVVSVPISVSILTGEAVGTFYATGHQLGTAQIKASLVGIDLYSDIEVVTLDARLRPKIHRTIEIRPRISSVQNIRPEPYDAETPDDTVLTPTIHDTIDLKPRGVFARNLRPEIIDIEES